MDKPTPQADFRCVNHQSSVYHDIFISYRVNTEKRLADKLALLLDAYEKDDGNRVRTFLDSNCLLDGGDWEQNFLSALHHSTLLVLLLSEDGLDLRSASYPHLTKIQAADKEQDNCLLEYEKALDLHKQGKVDILVLLVSKDEKLGGVSCRAKFPHTQDEVQKRLQMYSDTQEHQHRGGDKRGPRVPDTMAALLGFIAPIKRGQPPTFAHIDPDDPASRIPEILTCLRHAESKLNRKNKIRRLWEDIPFLKQKIVGFILGIVLPVISLMTIVTSRNARQKAIRFGVFLGHASALFALSVYAFRSAFVNLPKECGSLRLCMQGYYDKGLGKEDEWLLVTANCGTEFGVGDCLVKPNSDRDCAICFCDTYLFDCDHKDFSQKIYLFVALFMLFVSGLIFVVAFMSQKKSMTRKATMKV